MLSSVDRQAVTGSQIEAKYYERYPLTVVLLSNSFSLVLYAVGATIISGLHIVLTVPYVLYCVCIEISVLRGSCVHCFYYGKLCGFGKGRLASWLFKQGDPKHFAERAVSWREILPDIMVLLLPLLAGSVALVIRFSWSLALLMSALCVFSLAGNGIIRGAF